MKRLCASAISRSAIGSVRDQELRNRTPKCCGSHVESRVARIKVMSDFGVEKGRGALTCSTCVGRRRRKSRTRSQAPGQLVEVPVDDNANEIKKDRGHGYDEPALLLPASTSATGLQ
jgi:hypothetical protein